MMAETYRKRPREEYKEENDPIREERQERPHKRSIHDILFLMESEEEEPTDPNLSSLITTLQHELSSTSPSSSLCEHSQQGLTEPDTSPLNQQVPTPLLLIDQETPQEIMRYLLEASDDELGIPMSPIGQSPLEREEQAHQTPLEREGFDQLEFEEGLGLGLGSGLQLKREEEEGSLDCDGWWEMDDQAANYDDFLHSQLCYDEGKIGI